MPGKASNEGVTRESTDGLPCCRCKEGNVWRIKLRQCGHFVCIACALIHLKYWIDEENKARIKCVKRTCAKRIHENDIDALLDPENTDLDVFMKCNEREYLLHEHRKHSIYYAFGGMVKHCPLCKAIYTQYDGCNFVQCVSLRCRQRFCWLCNEPTETLQHFAGGGCKLGWDDLFKLCFILKFLAFTEGCILFITVPFISTTLIYFGPLFVLLSFPYQITLLVREVMRHADMTPATITAVTMLLYLPLLVVALPLALGSLLFLFPMSFTYCALAVIKCIPAVSRVCDVLSLLSVVAASFGLDQWRQLFRENCEANRQREVEIAQAEAELSESSLT